MFLLPFATPFLRGFSRFLGTGYSSSPSGLCLQVEPSLVSPMTLAEDGERFSAKFFRITALSRLEDDSLLVYLPLVSQRSVVPYPDMSWDLGGLDNTLNHPC